MSLKYDRGIAYSLFQKENPRTYFAVGTCRVCRDVYENDVEETVEHVWRCAVAQNDVQQAIDEAIAAVAQAAVKCDVTRPEATAIGLALANYTVQFPVRHFLAAAVVTKQMGACPVCYEDITLHPQERPCGHLTAVQNVAHDDPVARSRILAAADGALVQALQDGRWEVDVL
ncbi:hypothetical protein RI367_002902 [Sorochytrium milnesiophthora]